MIAGAVLFTTACGTASAPSSPAESFDARECGVTMAEEMEWIGETSLEELGLPAENLPPNLAHDEQGAVYLSRPDQSGGRLYCLVIDGEVAHTGVSPDGWTPPED